MKLAFISKNLPPSHCGVGGRTAPLAKELIEAGHEVTIWSSELSPQIDPRIKIRRVSAPWNTFSLIRMAFQLRAYRPDSVIIEFTPYLFAERTYGVNLFLPLWMLMLRVLVGNSIVLAAHELHYPVGFTKDRFLIGFPQWLQFMGLLFTSPKILFCYETPFVRYSKWGPFLRKKLAWIPTGPTLNPETVPSTPKQTDVPENHYILLQFGTAHPSRLFHYSFEALEKIQAAFGKDAVSLVFAGATQERINAELSQHRKSDLKTSVYGTGVISDSEAAYWMNRAKLVLSPFSDGISARRSSTLSALAFGKTVVSTRGTSTDSEIPWSRLCFLAPSLTPESFAATALKAFSDGVQGTHAPSREYMDWFPWAVSSQKLVNFLTDSKTIRK